MRGTASGAAAVALVGALLAGAPAAGATGTTERAGSSACEVVTMAQPGGSRGGTVTDIERVPGLGTVYAGSLQIDEADGSSLPQAVVWYGIDGRPRRVGPPGMHGTVHELRPTGIISGMGVDADGHRHAWLQSLRSGRVTLFDTGDGESVVIYHVNDRGHAAGTVWAEDFVTEARVWRRADRPGETLPHDGEDAQAWDISNDRTVVGSTGLRFEETADSVRWGAVWDADGTLTRVASNPGVVADTYPRLIDERGELAGFARWGAGPGWHMEAARWRTPSQIESLGLLPGGGSSGAYEQSEGGWVGGIADHFDPDSPYVDVGQALGTVSHAVLWTDEADHVRVLPSPFAVAHGIDDWRDWLSNGVEAAHTGLDQAGGSAHAGQVGDDFRMDPVVYLHASQCGERVPTTHSAYWEEPTPSGPPADASRAAPPRQDRPDADEELTGQG